MRYSAIGVLPVPPNERFPTHINGKLNSADLRIFLLYKKFLMMVIKPYNNAKGRNNTLKDFKKTLLKFIHFLRSYAIV